MGVSLPGGQSAARAIILVVDDEPDVAEPFPSASAGRAARYHVMHFAGSGEAALEKLTDGIEPSLIVILSDINMPAWTGSNCCGDQARLPDYR